MRVEGLGLGFRVEGLGGWRGGGTEQKGRRTRKREEEEKERNDNTRKVWPK